jgi:hypothetical protein
LIYGNNCVLLKSQHEKLRPFNQMFVYIRLVNVFQRGKILSFVEEQRRFIARTYVKYHVYC